MTERTQAWLLDWRKRMGNPPRKDSRSQIIKRRWKMRNDV